MNNTSELKISPYPSKIKGKLISSPKILIKDQSRKTICVFIIKSKPKEKRDKERKNKKHL